MPSEGQGIPRANEPAEKPAPGRGLRRSRRAGRAEKAAGRGAQAGRRRANGGGPVRRMQSALATAVKTDPDWKEF